MMQLYRQLFYSRSFAVVCGNFYADFGIVVDVETIPFQIFWYVDNSDNLAKVGR